MKRTTCSECKAWAKFEDTEDGECRMGFPSTPDVDGWAAWPWTTESEWCLDAVPAEVEG